MPVGGQKFLHNAGLTTEFAAQAPIKFEILAVNVDQKQPGYRAQDKKSIQTRTFC